MICPKCGEKYEDDMPCCLWCDAPNPDYTGQMPANEMTLPETDNNVLKPMGSLEFDHPEIENAQSPNSGKTLNGTLIFWFCELLDEIGVHCFVCGKTLRGLFYLSLILVSLFVIPFVVSFALFAGVHLSLLDIVSRLLILILEVLVFVDAWTIGCGRYINKKNGLKYRGGLWMKIIAVIGAISSLIYMFWGGNGIFFNVSQYISNDMKVLAVSELNGGVNDYLEKQMAFFNREHQMGSFEKIGYVSNGQYFEFKDLNPGVSVSYKINFDCSYQSTWTINPSIVDDKLKWNVTEPKDKRCSDIFPLKLELKEK